MTRIFHCYFAVSRFGYLRDINDPNCTYEGDNNMLLGQTSNFLLSMLDEVRNGTFNICSVAYIIIRISVL